MKPTNRPASLLYEATARDGRYLYRIGGAAITGFFFFFFYDYKLREKEAEWFQTTDYKKNFAECARRMLNHFNGHTLLSQVELDIETNHLQEVSDMFESESYQEGYLDIESYMQLMSGLYPWPA